MRRYFERCFRTHKAHPFLFVTPRRVQQTAERILRGDKLLVAALGAVSRAARPSPSSNEWDLAQKSARETLNAAYLAALYAAAGKPAHSARYSARARRALLRFVQIGAPGPNTGLGWLQHDYLVTLAFAYDLVWDLGQWKDCERDALKRFFYVHVGPLVQTMHSKHMSNHAAWPMCRVGTTALLFRDRALVRECLDGPDSYAARLAHEFFDDGMSYEQSAWLYHCFSVEPVFFFALAARNAGASPDPLALKVKNDLSRRFLGGSTGDYTMPFYPADVREFPRPRTKDLRLALTAQFDLLRPDTTCPAIGDYGGPTRPMSDHWIAEAAWDFYRDRRAARLLASGKRRAGGTHLVGDWLLTLAYGVTLPPSPRFPARSAIYPQAGYAVLKSPEGDSYWHSKAAVAVLKFGPFGNGHGHADKLHLDLAGAGQRCCIEELVREDTGWRYWNSTVSHNTVVVGGKSQPGNEAMFALNDSCGRLVARKFTKSVKFAVAEADGLFPGLQTYRRTLALADSYLVDVFEVACDGRTVFDWFLHGMGKLTLDGPVLMKKSLRFASNGYQYFTDVRGARVVGPFRARFSTGHAVFFPEVGPSEVFSLCGPWKKGASRPVLVVRRTGAAACYVAVHDFSGRAVHAVRAAGLDGRGILIEVKGRDFTDRLELNGIALASPAGTAASGRRRKVSPGVRYFRKPRCK